jgi:hypothetical protein
MESHAAPFRHVEAASAGHRDAPIMGAGLKALWVARILVACRVSILSVVAGVLLFLLALPARDLFADITFGALQASVRARVFWSAFFTYLVFVWAFPVHYAARRMLYSDAWMFSCRVRADIAPHKFAEIRKDLGWWIDWIPRWLAAVPFLAVLIGLWKAHSVVARTPALPPAAEAARQIHILVGLDVAIGLVFLVFLWRRRILAKRLSSRVAFALAWSYMAIVSLLFIASLTRPFLPADLAQRAAIVPLLLGCFVFFGTFLAWASHKICVPVLALSIVAALGVTALNPHFNDVRTLDRTSEDYSTRQIDIEDAVSKWKAANCDQQKNICPPAVIVALEGGASRAAFAAATAIGELLDQSANSLDAKDRATSPARRIFAISGVSGGSFGAATIRAALSDSLEDGQPPCQNPPPNWFGTAKGDVITSGDVKSKWRACLQALVSGDYLTPDFVGLASRDNLSPPNPLTGGSFLDDRAALMERTSERHYDYVVGNHAPGFGIQLYEDIFGPPASQSGLQSRFGFWGKHAPHGGWVPLLLLNGTSVGTGARVIASDLISTRAASESDGDKAKRIAIYPAAFDVFEMLSKPCVEGNACASANAGMADNADARGGPDIRLSTAALLSARFPIISPAGIIRAEGASAVADRVVDGGYFENAGLTTAMDVARELRRLRIVPVVLLVQNGPRTDASDPKSAACESAKPNPPPSPPRHVPPRGAATPEFPTKGPGPIELVFGVVVTPLVALFETRDGHGAEESTAARRELSESNYYVFGMFENPDFDAAGECTKLYEDWCRAPGKMSEVSMSWWLSQSVQAELDSQICDRRNRKTLADLADRLR